MSRSRTDMTAPLCNCSTSCMATFGVVHDYCSEVLWLGHGTSDLMGMLRIPYAQKKFPSGKGMGAFFFCGAHSYHASTACRHVSCTSIITSAEHSPVLLRLMVLVRGRRNLRTLAPSQHTPNPPLHGCSCQRTSFWHVMALCKLSIELTLVWYAWHPFLVMPSVLHVSICTVDT